MLSKPKYAVCKGTCDVIKEQLMAHKAKCLCNKCNNKRLAEGAKIRAKIRIEKGIKVDPVKMQKFYKDFWNNQYYQLCFESRVPIINYTSYNCHHLLEKHQYPQFALNSDVCVLLTKAYHDLWHSLLNEHTNPLKTREYHMPKTWAEYLKIKQKYNV